MKKKIYNQPTMDVHELEVAPPMLCTSGGNGNAGAEIDGDNDNPGGA